MYAIRSYYEKDAGDIGILVERANAFVRQLVFDEIGRARVFREGELGGFQVGRGGILIV